MSASLLINLSKLVENTNKVVELCRGSGIEVLGVTKGFAATPRIVDAMLERLHQDAFVLVAEILEIKEKSSMPVGKFGFDAFGRQTTFDDNGIRKRAIIELGKQDVNIDGLTPVDSAVKILGASSDYMILDVTDAEQELTIGSRVRFRLNYQGLLFLSNSRYVEKVYV